jgi:hypothetical protein
MFYVAKELHFQFMFAEKAQKWACFIQAQLHLKF